MTLLKDLLKVPDNNNKTSLFIDTKSVSLISIYDFLLNYKKQNY